jgi:SAM-dependent methyltransferase
VAHYTQHQFVRWVKDFFPRFFSGQRVLEVGSLDINGSVRPFFSEGSYLGLDVGPGPGVDLVCGGQDYGGADASFDVVCSFEAMEHNPHWEATFANMLRLVRPGGMVLMTCATRGRPEHGTTRTNPADSPLTIGIGWDHYRNLTARDFAQAFDLRQLFSRHFATHYYQGCDLLFVGFRAGAAPPAGAAKAFALLRWRYLLRNLLQAEARTVWLGVSTGRLS